MRVTIFELPVTRILCNDLAQLNPISRALLRRLVSRFSRYPLSDVLAPPLCRNWLSVHGNSLGLELLFMPRYVLSTTAGVSTLQSFGMWRLTCQIGCIEVILVFLKMILTCRGRSYRRGRCVKFPATVGTESHLARVKG